MHEHNEFICSPSFTLFPFFSYKRACIPYNARACSAYTTLPVVVCATPPAVCNTARAWGAHDIYIYIRTRESWLVELGYRDEFRASLPVSGSRAKFRHRPAAAAAAANLTLTYTLRVHPRIYLSLRGALCCLWLLGGWPRWLESGLSQRG